MRRTVLLGALGAIVGVILLLPAEAYSIEPAWQAVVSGTGSIRIESSGQEVAKLTPGLFEATWKSASMAEGTPGQEAGGDVLRGKIRAPGGAIVEVETRILASKDGAQCEYRLTPQSGIRLNSLHVTLELPSSRWAGGRFEADGKAGSLPAQMKETGLHSARTRALRLFDESGASLALDFGESTNVLVQDDRQWGPTFSVRIGPSMGETDWPAGKSLSLGFTLGGSGGLKVEKDEPVTIQAGAEWLPLDASQDVEPGSALDFSQVILRKGPAGDLGRVIVTPEGHFAFAQQPKDPVRFYGVNLCFSALYLDREVADRLADRLWRLGYNAVRIHHYEGELVERPVGGRMRLRPGKLDQLDHLFAALKRRGMYVTTDLFVSRPVAAAEIYPGMKGDIGMDEYKMAVHVNERAYEDYKAFARALLDHVNPYTRLRYADDPALAWVSLVNEDCPGNFTGSLKGPLRDDWQGAWNRWLAARYPGRPALVSALGKLPDDQDPAKGTVPLQDAWGNQPTSTVFNVFLATVERDFFERTRRFLREELRCEALLTDINAWHNPVQMQAVRTAFDYVDDHFYVDHPEFIERPWSLPSRCSNTSPIASGARGGRPCAFTRMFGKPFTITEFNYSSPGRFRGVGGILTGALGAVQDWDGVWRFAYSHSRDNIAWPSAMNYFDLAADPLNQAAERASLCLFLRGDLAPAAHSICLRATSDELLQSPVTSRDKTPPWHGLAWLTRVGWAIGDSSSEPNRLTLGLEALNDRSTLEVVSEVRRRGWLLDANRTDLQLNRFQSENSQVIIDAKENVLTLNTARTVGGFAPAGKRIETGAATVEIRDTDATVWVSSLDNQPIATSRRMLITHLTDLQNTETRYADRRRKVLLAWGRLPHLVHAGAAEVSLRLKDPSKAKVHRLSASGKREGEVADVRKEAGAVRIPLSVSWNGKACLCYEVVVGE